jgi:hypothetical protein
MNATGDSDLSIFTDRLTTIREINIDPFLGKVDRIISACIGIEQPTYEWQNPFPKSELDEATIRGLNMDTIIKMQQMELPDSVLVHRMADWGIIEGDDVDATIKAMEEMEPFDIEGEPEEEEEEEEILPIPKIEEKTNQDGFIDKFSKMLGL